MHPTLVAAQMSAIVPLARVILSVRDPLGTILSWIRHLGPWIGRTHPHTDAKTGNSSWTFWRSAVIVKEDGPDVTEMLMHIADTEMRIVEECRESLRREKFPRVWDGHGTVRDSVWYRIANSKGEWSGLMRTNSTLLERAEDACYFPPFAPHVFLLGRAQYSAQLRSFVHAGYSPESIGVLNFAYLTVEPEKATAAVLQHAGLSLATFPSNANYGPKNARAKKMGCCETSLGFTSSGFTAHREVLAPAFRSSVSELCTLTASRAGYVTIPDEPICHGGYGTSSTAQNEALRQPVAAAVMSRGAQAGTNNTGAACSLRCATDGEWLQAPGDYEAATAHTVFTHLQNLQAKDRAAYGVCDHVRKRATAEPAYVDCCKQALPGFDPEKFCASLNDLGPGGVLVVGDSLSKLFAVTLATMLGELALHEATGNISTGLDRLSFPICPGKWNRTLDFVRNDVLDTSAAYSGPLYHGAGQLCGARFKGIANTYCNPWVGRVAGASLVVLNSGAHAGFGGNRALSIEDYRGAMRRAAGAASQHAPSGSRLFFWTTPVGHPYCNSTDARGKYDWDQIPGRNAAASPVFADAGFTVLDVAPLTNLRPDRHLADCFHRCLPGPSMLWVQVMHAALLGYRQGGCCDQA